MSSLARRLACSAAMTALLIGLAVKLGLGGLVIK